MKFVMRLICVGGGLFIASAVLAQSPAPAPDPLTPSQLQIQELFGAQLAECWDLDMEVAGPIDYVVSLRIPLGLDGWMLGDPELNYDWDDPVLKDPVFQDLAESTINVLHACQPYVLPPDLYEGAQGWNQIEVVLAPELLSAP